MGLNRVSTQDRGAHSANNAVNLTVQGVEVGWALAIGNSVSPASRKTGGGTYCDKERVIIVTAVASCESAGELREQIGRVIGDVFWIDHPTGNLPGRLAVGCICWGILHY